jgi:hypothetical protein
MKRNKKRTFFCEKRMSYLKTLVLIRTYSSQASQIQIKLTLYTKKQCQLCDEAKELIDHLYPNRFVIEEIDIVKDRALFRKFKLDIPVFYHGSKFLMQHKVDKTALDSLIKEHETK